MLSYVDHLLLVGRKERIFEVRKILSKKLWLARTVLDEDTDFLSNPPSEYDVKCMLNLFSYLIITLGRKCWFYSKLRSNKNGQKHLVHAAFARGPNCHSTSGY